MCDIAHMPKELAEYIAASPTRSQQEWAELFGISRSYLSEILSGQKTPGRKAIQKIATATGGAVGPAAWFTVSTTDDGRAA